MLRALIMGLFLGNVAVYGTLITTWNDLGKPAKPVSVVTDAVWRPVPVWI